MDIIQRVKEITLKPKETWPTIKREETTIKELYTSYAVILAAIPPLASIVGVSLLDFSMARYHYQISIGESISQAVISYGLSLAGLYVIAQIIDSLASRFGSQKNLVNALKVSVFSSTPSWVAGFFLIFPILTPLVLAFSFYSLYLFYLGLPILMDTPKGKTLGYFLITILCILAAFILIGFISRFLLILAVWV